MNKKTITAIAVAVVLLIVVGVAYAALGATLEVTGNTTIKKQTWKVEFTDWQATAASASGYGAQAVTLDTFTAAATTFEWSTTLNVPNDYAEIFATIENTGTIDAKIAGSGVVLGTAASSATNVISYEVCYVKAMNSTTYVDAAGNDSASCVEPSSGDIYFGTTAHEADNSKITTRYIVMRVKFDADVVATDGGNLNSITAGTNVPEGTNETQTKIKLTTTIPFVQYTGA